MTSTESFLYQGIPVDITDSVTHNYAAPGIYVVTLTVTDDDAGSSIATTQVTIWGPGDLKANAITLLQTLDTENDCSGHHDGCQHHHDQCGGHHDKCCNPPLHTIIYKIQCSLDERLWVNATHLSPKWGHKVFNYEICAAVLMEEQIRHNIHEIPHLESKIAKLEAKGCDVEKLKAELAYMKQVNAVYEQALQNLVEADELLATVAIVDALAVVVQDPRLQHVVDHLIAKANKDLNLASSLVTSGHYACAIHFYKRAWQHAVWAVKIATKAHHGCGDHEGCGDHHGCEDHHDCEAPRCCEAHPQ